MPMWSSVANLKESLSKIALDVHDGDDDDEELSMYTSPPRDQSENGSSGSERRVSRNLSALRHSPIVNGFDSANQETDVYKREIKRLQESEAEIKALSVNYAALLKEKEDQISRLAEENGSLKQNLLNTNAALGASKTVLKGNGDISPSRHSKAAAKARAAGSTLSNGIVNKHDGLSNGAISTNTKELSDAEDKIRSLTVMQATQESQMKHIMMELDKERDKLASMQLRLQEEQKLSGSFQQELSLLKEEKNKMLSEINQTHDELKRKKSEIGRLQTVLQGRDTAPDESVEKLKTIIASLEEENRNIKKEKEEFEAALKAIRSSPVREGNLNDVDPSSKHSSRRMNEGLKEEEELQKSLHKLENDLKEARQQRDKALQGLNRLKQHLLEKESEESEKMDEDSKIIEELRGINEQQRVQLARLEKALKQAISSQEEIKMSNNTELMKAKETIDGLNRKLTSCFSTIEAKNVEVLNLQTALGQYYAEIEAKERLGEELSFTKEESARLTMQLKEAHQLAEALRREKEELLGKLSQADNVLAEGRNRVKKLEEDNEKIRRALEQSMTRLNRMSVDSDFLVDRRIVIKLLVTYFQRNHSKEVLDLMARMLGFSDEDKQRIGVAQQGGKGVVRGVLGLPGRFVGGILGSGASSEAHAPMEPDQSFSDLWVDFLLKETEREKREAANGSIPDRTSIGTTPLPESGETSARPSSYLNQNQSQIPSHGSFLRRDLSDSEFSTVPLTSSEQGSRLPPRY